MIKRSPTNTLTQQILNTLLRLPGCFAWRANTTGVFDAKLGLYRPAPKKGVSDIIGLYRGQFFGIEIKTGKDRLRAEQVSFIDSVKNAGGIVFVIGSLDEFSRAWSDWINKGV